MRKKSPFWQDNALFASKAKINGLLKFFMCMVPEGNLEGSEEKLSKNVDFSL